MLSWIRSVKEGERFLKEQIPKPFVSDYKSAVDIQPTSICYYA